MGRILFLLSMYGGSHASGLATRDSDIDYRGVFLNADVATVGGLDRREHITRSALRDECYHELRHFLQLLRKGNTGALEMLFSKEAVFRHSLFTLLTAHRDKLIDSAYLYKTLAGYLHSERRLANGERTGLLGAKRKQHIDRYGFSPKNFVQMFRLTHCGIAIFQRGTFPVNLREDAPEIAAKLYHIKTRPEDYTKERLNEEADRCVSELEKAFTNRVYDFSFDTELAHDICATIYQPVHTALSNDIRKRRHPSVFDTYLTETGGQNRALTDKALPWVDFDLDCTCELGENEAEQPESVTEALWPTPESLPISPAY